MNGLKVPDLDLRALCPPSVFDPEAMRHDLRDEGLKQKQAKADAVKLEVTSKNIKVIVVGAGLV